MNQAKSFIWLGVGIVALAYVLMAFVKAFLPILTAIGVLYLIYNVFTNRRW